MKARYLIGCIFIAGGIVFFFLWTASKPKTEPEQGIAQEPKADTTEINRQVAIEKAPPPPPSKVNASNGPLVGAYQMAAFLDHVIDSEPPEQATRRKQLKGFQAFYFINDYVMAAKTNSSLELSTSAIIAAFTNITQDTSIIRSRLALWAERPGTLTDHYQATSEIPTEKDHIKTIKAAMTENGVAIDTESDLLMDCIRYSCFISEIHEMYGTNPRNVADATPYPSELNALVRLSDTIFRHRFETKFGLNPSAVTSMMSRLREVRIYDLSPADMEIPAHIR